MTFVLFNTWSFSRQPSYNYIILSIIVIHVLNCPVIYFPVENSSKVDCLYLNKPVFGVVVVRAKIDQLFLRLRGAYLNGIEIPRNTDHPT